MNLAPRTLEDLAWQEILSALSSRCRTEAGKQRAEARPFLAARAEVESALTVVEEARKLAQEQFSFPFGAMADVRLFVPRAEKGGMLEPRELMAISQVLFAFSRTRDALLEREHAVPALAAVSRRLPDREDIAQRIERCFESDGTISDRASPALKEARDRTRGLHRSIMQRLDKLLHDENFLPNLRERYYSVRNGRYVVPVLSSHQAAVPGIVHNASQTGQTLFVEPQAMVSLGNELAIAESLVLEEERRLLQELSDLVGKNALAIEAGIDAAAELDEAEAAARLCGDLDAHTPQVLPANGDVDLTLVRHPLLALRGPEVVANDVRLTGESRCLVVSGPNAGGKTVTLTTVGLCALMLRAGLQIPAAPGSRMPLYHTIHSAVGDAQDLSRGLSTFSAHILELRSIVLEAEPGGLVLIDEIAADTDPREGAAIAVAVLEDLLTRGAVVLVTTHLEEIKALAHLDPRFVNARVGFDSRKMTPTYRLQIGASGASSAIDLAARMGLPERIVLRSRELAQNSGGALAKALSATEEDRRQLALELDRAKETTAAAEVARAAAEEERVLMESRLREQEVAHREALHVEMKKAQEQMRELLQGLREQGSVDATLKAQRELGEKVAAEERELAASRAAALRAKPESAPADLRVGGWVHHVGLGRDVELLELDDDEALVAAGPLKMRVQVRELAPAHKGKPGQKFPASGTEKKTQALSRAKEAAPAEVTAANFRCDIRGMRGDAAMREVEQFLDRIYRSGEEAAIILHGHGTGALKQVIRQYLADSPYVRSYRPGQGHEGGDGVTVVALKV